MTDTIYRLKSTMGVGGKNPKTAVHTRTFTTGTGSQVLSYGNTGIAAPISCITEVVSASGAMSACAFHNRISGEYCTVRAECSAVDVSVRIIVRNF